MIEQVAKTIESFDVTKEESIYLFHDGGRYHIETSPLICRANQWTVFYMITASVMKELNVSAMLYCVQNYLAHIIISKLGCFSLGCFYSFIMIEFYQSHVTLICNKININTKKKTLVKVCLCPSAVQMLHLDTFFFFSFFRTVLLKPKSKSCFFSICGRVSFFFFLF